MVKIRFFSPEDMDRIMEIEKASFPQPWPRSEFEKYKIGFFVAEENKKIIGFVIGKVLNNKGIIKKIAVEPVYRGRGIGKILLEYILKFLKTWKVREILARTRTQNNTSINFLKSFNFKPIETIEKYYPNGDDAYLMKKEI